MCMYSALTICVQSEQQYCTFKLYNCRYFYDYNEIIQFACCYVHCDEAHETHSHLLQLHDITNFVRRFYFMYRDIVHKVKFACMKIVNNVIITKLYIPLL